MVARRSLRGPRSSAGVGVAPGNGGPEASARDARYAALHAAAGGLHSDGTTTVPAHPTPSAHPALILLGHTLDDQAETVLLGLARGSGARALAGMAAARGDLRRPCLGLTRAQTEQICAEVGLTWWTDPTNKAPDEAPATQQPPPLRSGYLLTNPPIHQQISTSQRGEVSLDTVGLAAEPTPIRRRVLHLAAVRAGSPGGAITRVHILGLDALITSWRGQGPSHLPGNIRASREYGRLVLQPPTS